MASDAKQDDTKQNQQQNQNQQQAPAQTDTQIQPRTLKIPITNVYAKGDYCAQFVIGSEEVPVNLILDTGSSTLVINQGVYSPQTDNLLVPTSLAQEINYGVGGWDGPVVKTSVSVANKTSSGEAMPALQLDNCPTAIVHSKAQQTSFFNADGMLGLGYHHLNKCYDLATYFQQHNITPAVTYPWPFAAKDAVCLDATDKQPEQHFSSESLQQFKHFLWQQPKRDLTPYFTDLEQHGLTKNKFAFYCKRSSIHTSQPSHTSPSASADGSTTPQQLAELAKDPLNQGWLILGGGEEHTELYSGEFQSIKVDHDVYYNVTLTSMTIGQQTPNQAAPLQAQYIKSAYSNAIIDTGASCIAVTDALFQALIKDMSTISASFKALIEPFKDFDMQDSGIDMSLIALNEWPDIAFSFVAQTDDDQNQANLHQASLKKTSTITLSPKDYWQLNTPTEGKACFKIIGQLPDWPNQSLMGLPLMTGSFVVFDRSIDTLGVIKFAKQKV